MVSPERRHAKPPCHCEWGYLVWHRNSASACGCALYPLPQRKLPFCGVEIILSFRRLLSASLNETGLVLLFRKRNRHGNGMKLRCLVLPLRLRKELFFEAGDLEQGRIFRGFRRRKIAESKAEQARKSRIGKLQL